MSEQEVPWAEGRCAIAVLQDGVRLSVTGEFCEEDGVSYWVPEFDPMGVLWEWISADECTTELRSDQCPECYEVGEHGGGCRIAENLRRGVPAFWARWAHFEEPGQTVATVYQWGGCDFVRMYDAADALSEPIWRIDGGCDDGAAPMPGKAWLAFGLDGAPTNEPWDGE